MPPIIENNWGSENPSKIHDFLGRKKFHFLQLRFSSTSKIENFGVPKS